MRPKESVDFNIKLWRKNGRIGGGQFSKRTENFHEVECFFPAEKRL